MKKSPHLQKLVLHLTFVILALPEDGQCHCLTICFLTYVYNSELTIIIRYNYEQTGLPENGPYHLMVSMTNDLGLT